MPAASWPPQGFAHYAKIRILNKFAKLAKCLPGHSAAAQSPMQEGLHSHLAGPEGLAEGKREADSTSGKEVEDWLRRDELNSSSKEDPKPFNAFRRAATALTRETSDAGANLRWQS